MVPPKPQPKARCHIFLPKTRASDQRQKVMKPYYNIDIYKQINK